MQQGSTVAEFSAHAARLISGRTAQPTSEGADILAALIEQTAVFPQAFSRCIFSVGQVCSDKDPAYCRTNPLKSTLPTFAALSAQSRD